MKPAENKYQLDHTLKPLVFGLIKEHKNEEAMEYFKLHPKEVELKGWMSDTPLHVAAKSGNYDMVQYLLENGANVNAQRTGVYATPLCWAENKAIAKLLLDNGATMNDLELYLATRQDKIEVMDLLLKNGARINNDDPQYLQCKSIAAIKVYLKNNIDINGADKNKSNLLHKLAWLDLPEVLDFVLNIGVPWKKDSSERTPFYLAKQGKRNKVLDHLSKNYPQLISNKIKDLDVDLAFEKIACILKHPNTAADYIALTQNGKLIHYKTIGIDALAVSKAIEIDVPIIRNFTINASNDLIIPTGDHKLLKVSSEDFQLMETILLDEDIILNQITYLPKRKVYLGSSSNWEIIILKENFELISKNNAEDGTFFPIVNENENLLAFWSYDHETFFDLYRLDSDFQVNFIHTFFENEHIISKSFAFLGDEILVAFPNKIEVFKMEQHNLIKTQELNIEAYPSSYDMSSLHAISNKYLLLAKGNKVIVYNKLDEVQKKEEIQLELNDDIRKVYYDDRNKKLLVITNVEIRFFDFHNLRKIITQ